MFFSSFKRSVMQTIFYYCMINEMRRFSHIVYNHLQNRIGLKFANKYDLFMFIVAFVSPIMTFPQVVAIWIVRHHQGVSLLTWLTYGTCAVAWLIYGYIHREKVIIFSQIILIVLDFSVVLGLLIATKA